MERAGPVADVVMAERATTAGTRMNVARTPPGERSGGGVR